MGWEPQEQGLVQLATLLGEFQKPGSNQTQILQQLQQFSVVPDFNNYLVYIFACSEQLAVEIRQSAGLLLKNNLKSQVAGLPPDVQAYIKDKLILVLPHTERVLRHTCGTIVSGIVGAAGLSTWPQLVSALAACMQSGNDTAADGGVSTLFKIIEDAPRQLDIPLHLDASGTSITGSDALVGVLISLMQSGSDEVRSQAVACLNLLAREMPKSLYELFDGYLEGLFALTQDASSSVRRQVCIGLVQLLSIQPDRLQPFLYQIIEYMLASNEHADQEVAVESCEFWMSFCDAELDPGLLKTFLPRLIPLLMKNMVFEEYDDEVSDAEAAETSSAKQEKDSELKPFMASDREHGTADEEDDDSEGVARWNLRRCSAAGLDRLSLVFGDELLPILLPIVEQRLNDTDWRARESAILALGAIAEGCHQGLMPYLDGMVAMLLPKMSDPRPMVRIISCWASSRYAHWLFSAAEAAAAMPGGAAQSPLAGVVAGLLGRVLEHNKFVQEAACSALANIVEEAAKENKEVLLHPYMKATLETLGAAVARFTRRNLRLLYDVLDTLSESLGDNMCDPSLVPLYLAPLLQRFQMYDLADKDLLPLMDCLANIVPLVSVSVVPYAPSILEKCLKIVSIQMDLNQVAQLRRHQPAAEHLPVPPGVPEFDKDALVCALDMMSGLIEAMGSAIEPLLSGTPLLQLIIQCCRDEAPRIRQSAFAMIGELAKACPSMLAQGRADILTLSLLALDPSTMTQETIKSCNNACWALGELVVQMNPEDLKGGGAERIAEAAAGILLFQGRLTRGILENAAITLGRIAYACPEPIAPHFGHFCAPWCSNLRIISDGTEKEQAFLGLCNLIRSNPEPACQAFVQVAGAVVSWRVISCEGLANSLSQVMAGMKQHLSSAGHWQAAWSTLDVAVRAKLEQMFQL